MVITLKSGAEQDLYFRISHIKFIPGVQVDHRNILFFGKIPDRVVHIPEPSQERRVVIVRGDQMVIIVHVDSGNREPVVPHEVADISEVVRVIMRQVNRKFRVSVVQQKGLERILAVRHKGIHEEALTVTLDHGAVSPALISKIDGRDRKRHGRIRLPVLRGVGAKLSAHGQYHRKYVNNSLSKSAHLILPHGCYGKIRYGTFYTIMRSDRNAQRSKPENSRQ